MEKELVITAPSVEEAIESALKELGARREEVEVEVIQEPAKRFFGEDTDAEVRVVLVGSLAEAEGEAAEGEAAGALADDEIDEADATVDAGAEAEAELEADEAGDGDSEADEADEAELDDANVADEEPTEDQGGDKERNFNERTPQLSDEEVDTIADTAIETIQGLLGYFGIQDASIDEYEGEEGELILDIGGENLAILIGRHGKTLESLQFIVASIVAKKTGYRFPVIVDIEGYKHRRKQKLVGIARSSATRVIRQKKEISLRPMTPYERRIVHVALKDDNRITTHSEGTEPNRYVVIRPT